VATLLIELRQVAFADPLQKAEPAFTELRGANPFPQFWKRSAGTLAIEIKMKIFIAIRDFKLLSPNQGAKLLRSRIFIIVSPGEILSARLVLN